MRKKNSKTPWIVLLICSILLLGVLIGAAVFFLWPTERDYGKFYNTAALTTTESTACESTAVSSDLSTETTEPTVTQQILPDNPIDFVALQEVNPEAYAWIYVPNTCVDYPILQSSRDDNYYLHRNLEGNYEFRGSIYTQSANAKDFSDPVTVIYGHHMSDDSMFSTLYYFRDKQFFEENDVFYIYTPGHILTYRIISAHKYDERHILNSFDFSKETIFQEYIDYILEPKTMIAAVREGVTLTTDDRIVTLSTCIEYGSSRYLVQGVLISDERTN